MPHQEGLVLKSAQLHIYELLYRKKERLHCTGFRETSHATTGHVPYKLGIAIMCLHTGPQTPEIHKCPVGLFNLWFLFELSRDKCHIGEHWILWRLHSLSGWLLTSGRLYFLFFLQNIMWNYLTKRKHVMWNDAMHHWQELEHILSHAHHHQGPENQQWQLNTRLACQSLPFSSDGAKVHITRH